MMKNLFEQSRSHWVRYDHYELKTAEDGKRYITPGKSAKPDVYNPLKEVPNIVLDALNVGMLMMGRKPEAEVEKAIMEFITRYGLLGLMTALPTTPSFMDYEAVYLPKNHFIKEESMATDKYLSLFYPFDQLDLVKKGIESTWNVSGDRTMVALMGLGANTTDIAIYPRTSTDSAGADLTGQKTYTLHFDALPPTVGNGFWSVTAYGEDNFLIDNPISRYCVNDRSGLHRNADGSVDVTLSKDAPEDTTNWLPVSDEKFHLFLRIYKPDWTALDSFPPPVISVK